MATIVLILFQIHLMQQSGQRVENNPLTPATNSEIVVVKFEMYYSAAVMEEEDKYLKTNFRRHYADLYYQVGQIISCSQRSFNKDF